ncbi:MAG TPA: YMGG-like glycine zipper-containing protein [Gemmatimonadaceae bacterium]|jgi:outer membrane lipoprotein SlyB|nr:YMGG-like glycine zipper-containing protein [Gemmatimonadaceae bacterium]
MKRTISTLALAVAASLAACGRSDNRVADTTLNRDLSLAAQARGDTLDSLSAIERGRQANALGAPAPASTTPRHTAARTTTRRSSSSGGEVVGSSSASRTTTSSSGTVVKHTKRDAAIGAAAGAVIGATTSRNKVKGGVIGAAVGGILGGIIGNNVDKTKKKP